MFDSISFPMKQDDISWHRRLAFVGMFFEMTRKRVDRRQLGKFRVKRNGGGLVSYGDTIESAASGQNIDWWQVDEKINQADCDLICHC